MTEQTETEKTARKPWRCEKCGSTIAITRNGECTVRGKVTLGRDYTKVVCPVCGSHNKWFFNVSAQFYPPA